MDDFAFFGLRLGALLVNGVVLLDTAYTGIPRNFAVARRSLVHLVGISIAHTRFDGLGANRYTLVAVSYEIVVTGDVQIALTAGSITDGWLQ